jgi:flagellar assembly protein FliH
VEIIIAPDKLGTHKIVKYEFKNFNDSASPTKESAPQRHAPPILPTAPADGFTNEEKEALKDIRAKQLAENDLVANLVQKVESFADNIAKLQIKSEKQESDFAIKLENETKRSYEEGKKTGELEATNRLLGEIETKRAQLAESIAKLDTALREFGDHAASIEKELTSVAVEIANEVLTIEIGENSAKIASSLAVSLLNSVKDALKISIRVNPSDIAAVSEAIKDDARVEVVPDRAVAEGGVIVHSEAGNIDARLNSRFAAIKKSILEGGGG